MSKFMTLAFILEKHGARLDKHQIAAVLGITAGTVMNHISNGTLGFATYTEHGKTWASAEAIAEHLNKKHEEAAAAAAA